MKESAAEWLSKLRAAPTGLSSTEAERRLKEYGPNAPQRRKAGDLDLLLRQFKNPIIILLIAASILSGFLEGPTDAVIILAILAASIALSFFQERSAGQAVQKLASLIESKVAVIRDGASKSVGTEDLVIGDVAILTAGSHVPADGLVLESDLLLVDEAAMTGESAPVEKGTEVHGDNGLFAGTYVLSGSGLMLVTATGIQSELGKLSQRIASARPEPEFQRGIRQYGYMLTQYTLLLTMVVFAVNVAFHRPLIESFLFSLALSVGLTPQLLPAILTMSLSKGAKQLAAQKVVVRRLESIEDFGSMDVLCSDKTGTLTRGTMTVAGCFDAEGAATAAGLRAAAVNAKLQAGFSNPIDDAIGRAVEASQLSGYQLVRTIPYDFFRRRLSVAVKRGDETVLITKGAVEAVLGCCTMARSSGGEEVPIATAAEGIQREFEKLSKDGMRVLAVASKTLAAGEVASSDAEQGLVFLGLVALQDPLRDDSAEMVRRLAASGVKLKIITGDNRFVAAHIAGALGLSSEHVVLGEELKNMLPPLLPKVAARGQIFAEIDPIQKEHLILALKKSGHVVGYIGDGINDVGALHAADVGISVSSAVDIAREAADLVMLESGLAVIHDGISEGRRIFANTLKYVFVTTSANFGNMFSMAVASLWLPFLPLLPKQILLNNLLTDLPAIAIPTDSVDEEMMRRPRRWQVKHLRNFMIVFGLQSSVFDLLSFFVLLNVLKLNPSQFRTGWFLESAISEVVILLIIRTRRRFFQSRPGGALLVASLAVAVGAAILPYSPVSRDLGFEPLSAGVFFAVTMILGAYALTAELMKRKFMKAAGGL